MKLSSLNLLSMAAIMSVVFAFSDTAPLYSSKQLMGKFNYITQASAVSNAIKTISSEICESGDGRLIIYRVSKLLRNAPSDKGFFIRHVHYDTVEDLDFTFGPTCDGSKVEFASYSPGVENGSSEILIIDVEDEANHTVDEFLDHSSNTLVIVQGKPLFGKPESKVEGIKHYIEDKVFDNLNVELDLNMGPVKRANSEDDDFEKIAEEVEDDFKQAQSLVAEEGNNTFVTIMDTSTTDEPIVPAKARSVNLNLFTNYQFFTPGIWMGLIVSGFLIFVFYIALSWISSLEISYKAFDKQIDFEKKNE
ncbi:uncharacterized protein PRCAT00005907001 [Priceomyces carsonii]|uniref:uncharacterized protein n=1 Tax=Priceomyces carsonii TaxID=28549 RepID=UPI002EDA6EDA|nr:unnamed protein product [Priceomyces carsonii]